ncbi:MAG: 30S ribosomal protein S11 [Parcubacteria group bacterium ADurb.Bin316]|nr:MAG: 30S ribosomal protein S11 [Parcubacteria group bacterium ADurb.Bin316]
MTDDLKNTTENEKTEVKPETVAVEKIKDEEKEEKNDNPLGLEELPEEIKKKLEKKKAEKDQTKGKKGAKKRKKRVARKVSIGKAFVKATYNNTIVTLTDMQGNVIAWASAGMAGFKGPKKSTPYAASIITRLAVGKAREDYGLQEVSVFVRGVGTGRESAVRALNSNGLIINSIKDITPIPHNGCRPKKPRRV